MRTWYICIQTQVFHVHLLYKFITNFCTKRYFWMIFPPYCLVPGSKNDIAGIDVDNQISWCYMACGTESKKICCIAGMNTSSFHFLTHVVILLACWIARQDWVINTKIINFLRLELPSAYISRLQAAGSIHYILWNEKWPHTKKKNCVSSSTAKNLREP